MDRSDFTPGPLADVECDTSSGRPTLVFVRELRQAPDQVWAALTDPAQLEEWSPFTADRDLGSIGDATLTMIDGDVRDPLKASVLRAEPPRLLEYTWGSDLLRWELDPIPTGTRLMLRHTLDDPDYVPMVAAGWHLCLDVADLLLAGDPIGPIRGAEAREFGWDQLREAYAGRLGGAGRHDREEEAR